MMNMDMTTSSSMPMASSMSESGMSSVFSTAMDTPLYSATWTPHSPAGYAGTCIFLILFAAIWRGVFAFKSIMERRWLDTALRRRYVVVAGRQRESERVSQESENKGAVLMTERGVEEEVRVVRRNSRGVMPWRWSVDLPRALIVLVLSGMGYLLMLAIMTFNVGYFLSVLGGIFLGEIAVGRYSQMEEH